mmetsp:Transcript_11154/g.33180  ORF Transcript_11154/g.33180 Transcript_11154/m.33180 type:complete len:224 (+) Transcript_11154:765-1436(+)
MREDCMCERLHASRHYCFKNAHPTVLFQNRIPDITLSNRAERHSLPFIDPRFTGFFWGGPDTQADRGKHGRRHTFYKSARIQQGALRPCCCKVRVQVATHFVIGSSVARGSPGCCRRSYPKPSSHQGLCRGHSRKALAVACRGPSTTGTGSRRPRSGLPWPASSTNGHNLECPASSWALLLPPTAWTRPNTAIRCRAWSFLLPAWSCCCGLAASRLQSRTAYG